MIFLWSKRNTEHIAKHHVARREAEEVVRSGRAPYPQPLGDDKYAVWGPTLAGRFLQVVLVYAELEDIEWDEYEELELYDRLALEEGDEAVRVVHARDLTDPEKRQLRRRRRGLP